MLNRVIIALLYLLAVFCFAAAYAGSRLFILMVFGDVSTITDFQSLTDSGRMVMAAMSLYIVMTSIVSVWWLLDKALERHKLIWAKEAQ